MKILKSRVRVFVCQNTLVCLWILKSRVRVFVCQNTLVCLLLSKVGLLWGEYLIIGNRGSFLKSLINFAWNNSLYVSTSVFDLEIGNWVWFAKTKPSGGKRMIQICQIWIKNKSSSHLHWSCTSFSCFLLCWHKSPKRGRLKGKCALGPFLSILVIECQHKWTYVNLGKVMDKVQIKWKGMFLRLSTLFWRLMYCV